MGGSEGLKNDQAQEQTEAQKKIEPQRLLLHIFDFIVCFSNISPVFQ